MIKITRWKPDTCSCEIEYEWDDTQKEDVRVHTISNVLKTCPAHSGELDKTKHYEKVLGENQIKNKLFGEILEKVPNITDVFLQDNGSSVKQLKKGLDYRWSFDVNRILVVDLIGFKTEEKEIVRSIINNPILSSKIRIN